MDLNRENMKKIRGLILFTIVILVCLWQYASVYKAVTMVIQILFPFILGAAIAFVLNVPTHFFETHLFREEGLKKYKIIRKLARPASLIITLLCVLGAFGLVLFVMAPQLGNTFANLGKSVALFIPRFQDWITGIFGNNREIGEWIANLQFDWGSIFQAGVRFFSNGAGSMLDSAVEAVRTIANGFIIFIVAFTFGCYIILQKESLNIQMKKVIFAFVPKGKAEAFLEVCSLTYGTFSSFLAGQCVEAIILGTMFVVTMYVFRLPYALLTGIVIGFTALIPILGSFIGCALGVFMIFIENPVQAITFFVLFLVLQQVEGNLIYPHVVGNSVGLPSIYVLAAVTIGGRLMGVVGMLIFIPIVSVLYALFREIIHLKLKKNKITIDDLKEE